MTHDTGAHEHRSAESVLVAIRRIIRAVDLHSKRLLTSHGLTGPQLVALNELIRAGEETVTGLAKRISLSQGTVTAILDRLENRGYVARTRSDEDRRRVLVRTTDEGREIAAAGRPYLLQERFVDQYDRLAEWEKMMILSALARVAQMMEIDEDRLEDASPILVTGPLSASPEETLKYLSEPEPPTEP
jgi:DNA-binding MarR family transcriptional regulator